MSAVTYETYTTVEAALNSLGVPEKMRANRVKKLCRLIGAAHGIDTRKVGGSVCGLAYHVFKKHADNWKMFSKSIRIVQTLTSVVFFSDDYQGFAEQMDSFVATCAKAGLTANAFIKKYPDATFNDGWSQPSTTHVVSYGYRRYYRGCLIGVKVLFD